jgi:hypothetical protein
VVRKVAVKRGSPTNDEGVQPSLATRGESNNLGEMAAESGGLWRHFLLPFTPILNRGLFQNPCLLEAPKFGQL